MGEQIETESKRTRLLFPKALYWYIEAESSVWRSKDILNLFLEWKLLYFTQLSMNLLPNGPNNKLALVQIVA